VLFAPAVCQMPTVPSQCQGLSSSSKLNDIEKVFLILSMCGGVGGLAALAGRSSSNKMDSSIIVKLDIKHRSHT